MLTALTSRLKLSCVHSENLSANLNCCCCFTTQSQWQACSQATHIFTASVALEIEKWSVCGLSFSCLIDCFFVSLTVAFKPEHMCLKAATYLKRSNMQWRKCCCSLGVTAPWTPLSTVRYIRFWYMPCTSVDDRSMDRGDVCANKRLWSTQTTFIYNRFKILTAADM